MGGGGWDVGTYDASVSAAKTAGKSVFDYSSRVTSGRAAAKVHDLLDPKKLNTVGKNVREALDSAEHPNATPIAVLFDVTGSMRDIPMVLQEKLPQLHGLLQRKGYVEDPQILFGAIGDATSDRLPLQVGQFESDNRMDEALTNIVLEGGGGGGNHESYELAAYYMARHVDLDANKRGRKGYLFFIGDERLYARIDRRQVKELIGDTLQEDLTTVQIFEELKAKFDVFFLFASPNGGYRPEDSLYNGGSPRGWSSGTDVCYWRDLLGQQALVLADPSAVCEFIAMQLATAEGGLSVEEAMEDLLAIGADPTSTKNAGKALVAAGAGTRSAVAKTEGTLPDVGAGGATRL